MLLLGLGHKARQGKDTFAKACVDAYGNDFDIRLASFADPLRKEVTDAAIAIYEATYPGLPFNSDTALQLLCEHSGVPFDPYAIVEADYPWGKQRKLLQWWGQEYRRAQDPDYWTNKAEELIERFRTAGADALIFRDLRYFNEYDLVGLHKGLRIKIHRPGYVSDVPEHISETQLDNATFDFQLGFPDGRLYLAKLAAEALFPALLRRRK